MRSLDVTEVDISSELLDRLESLPDSRLGARDWTDEKRAALLKYWLIKKCEDVASALGMSEKACRKEYNRLVNGG